MQVRFPPSHQQERATAYQVDLFSPSSQYRRGFPDIFADFTNFKNPEFRRLFFARPILLSAPIVEVRGLIFLFLVNSIYYARNYQCSLIEELPGGCPRID
jgi:hypothetical protein